MTKYFSTDPIHLFMGVFTVAFLSTIGYLIGQNVNLANEFFYLGAGFGFVGTIIMMIVYRNEPDVKVGKKIDY